MAGDSRLSPFVRRLAEAANTVIR